MCQQDEKEKQYGIVSNLSSALVELFESLLMKIESPQLIENITLTKVKHFNNTFLLQNNLPTSEKVKRRVLQPFFYAGGI